MDPPRQSAMPYTLTEEDKRILSECSRESFFYRALPFCTGSVLFTQILIKKGTLVAHPKWGSAPKLIFAGLFGYLIGKMSYMERCKEKLKNSENSQLGEILRKQSKTGRYSQQPKMPSSVESVPAGEVSRTSKYPVDNYGAIDFPSHDDPMPFSSTMNESTPSGIADRLPPEHVPPVEEGAKRKITYEELRNKNREMYGAGMQKSDIPSKPLQERPFKSDTMSCSMSNVPSQTALKAEGGESHKSFQS